jgi:superfamily II DNA or RNA helicase
MLSVRPYQRRALDAIEQAEREGLRRPLLVYPTGTGKTVIFSHAIAERADRGRSLVLVHREELAAQTVDKIQRIAPELSTGIVKADRNDLDADVVVASVQTVSRDKRLAELIESGRRSPFGTLIVDEAHHAPAPTWTKVLQGMGSWSEYGPLTVGFTATPERDNKTLGVWERVVSYMSIREAIYGDRKKDEEGGYLVPILPAVVVETKMDMSKVRKGSDGDLSGGDLGKAMEDAGAIEQIADAYAEHARDRKGVAFTPTIATAHHLAAELCKRGIPAEAVDGNTETELRRAILRRLKTGETQVVVNCAVLTEGFDEPSISCVVVARPTKFHGLYVQMVGRGTRLYPGKNDLMVLDIVGASNRHELVGLVDLGLDMDDPRKKPGDESERMQCPTCKSADCGFPDWHRCKLCKRYLPVSVTTAGGTRHVNCRAQGGGKVDVFGTSRLAWLPLPGGAYCLGAGKEVVVMAPLGTDTWKLAAYEGNRLTVIQDEVPADWAMGIGEDRAKAFQRLVERTARWRKGRASEAQKSRLLRQGFPESKLHLVKTMGEASDLSTRITGRHALKKMGLLPTR